MKRRLPPILMTLVLVCALPIWAAFVTSGDVTNPLVCTAGATSPEESAVDKLKLAISSGVDAQLTEDIEITQTLYVERSMTIDLNGHVLKMTGDGSVLRVEEGPHPVTLTITDSRPQNPHTGSYAGLPAGGVITGGKGPYVTGIYYVGGAVFLEKDTTLKLEGGTLTGNSGSSIYIGGATLVMSGGTITGETVGVYNNVGTFTMTGGRITGCSDRGVYVYNGNMTMSGTAYIGENPNARREDIYVYESDHKHTDLSVTGGTIAGKVRIVFLESLGPTQDNLRAAANSVVKEQGVFDGHIKVEKGTSGTCVDYNSVNFIDEVAKTRTLKLVLQPYAVEKPETPATVNGREFMYWAKEGASEAWDFNTEIKEPLTLYAVRTPASSGGYYYYPTPDTKADDAKGSPKTADPGVALYAALSLLSLTGLTCTAKKR
ncbi:MAG: right-handed parallel beta-helix repeat-containing protein [Oscillospiraceae bacterium]